MLKQLVFISTFSPSEIYSDDSTPDCLEGIVFMFYTTSILILSYSSSHKFVKLRMPLKIKLKSLQEKDIIDENKSKSKHTELTNKSIQ